MSGRVGGSGSASAKAVFDRTVAESVRQAKRLGQHDPTFVPPGDDASSILAAQMFSRAATPVTSTQKKLTFDTHLQAGDPSYDGTADATLTSDATNANTPSTLVARDGAGSFAAEVITATDVIATADVTANGGTVHGLHGTFGDAAVTGNIASSGGTVSGVHGSFGDVATTGNIASSGGTVSGLHGSFGDVAASGNIASSGGTVSGLHSVFGDLRINIAPTANVFSSTHTIPININGTTYLLLLHT